MVPGEYQVRELWRQHNEAMQRNHLLREQRVGNALRALSWTQEQLSVYQDRVAGIEDRLTAVLSRKPTFMRNRRLVR